MSGLRAGAGRQMITPPVGIPFCGHLYPERLSEGIHDDIWAKALVLEQGSQRVAIIALDLCWPLPENDYVQVREAVEKATGIPGANVMVSCTHNHQGPVFGPHPIFALSIKKQQELIGPWIESIPDRIVDAVRRATEDMKDATVSFGRTSITGLTYNRRKHIPEGVASLTNVDNKVNKFHFGDTPDMPRCVQEQYVNWGMSEEEAEDRAPLGLPDGPIDPDLDVVHVADKDGKTIAVLANFACHAVSCSPPVPQLISAGFPGFMASLVEQETKGVCLFTYGAGGDIRPYRSSARGFEEAQRVGFVLATGVMEAIRQAETVKDPELKVQSQTVKAALRKYASHEETQKQIKEKKKLLEEARAQGKVSEAKKLNDEIDSIGYPLVLGVWEGRDEWTKQKGDASLDIQAIAIGDVVLLSLPNEVNVSVGREIKDAAWTKKLLLVTLANGCWMYLVKKEEYEEGGYEAAGARLAAGAGEKMIAAVGGLVKQMKKA